MNVPTADAMRAIGAAIAQAVLAVEDPFVIALVGELGAGKTTLIGGFVSALGFGGHARSPTYTLIEPYDLAGRSIFHLDLYRLNDPREVEALGLRDLLITRSVFLIEWPERGERMLPPIDLEIRIRYSGADDRELELIGLTSNGRHVRGASIAMVLP